MESPISQHLYRPLIGFWMYICVKEAFKRHLLIVKHSLFLKTILTTIIELELQKMYTKSKLKKDETKTRS